MAYHNSPTSLNDSKEWFSEWFNSPYYHILYKNRDEQEAQRLIDNLCQYLGLENTEQVMDLACGRGRHAIYLHQKGLKVLGVDLSEENIRFAKQFEKENLHFEVGDMRQLTYHDTFDCIMNLFTSFGYFDTPQDNIEVLKRANNNLKKQGKIIIDFFNTEKVIQTLPSQEIKTIEGINFQIEKKCEQGIITKDIYFNANAQKHHFQERVQAISYADMQYYCREAKMEVLAVFGNYSLEPFDVAHSDRMIFIAQKEA